MKDEKRAVQSLDGGGEVLSIHVVEQLAADRERPPADVDDDVAVAIQS